jgi:hypothetical protein
MHQLTRLVADRLDQARVAVPQRAHGDAHAEIEIAFPRFIPQASTRTAHWDEWKTSVGGKHVLQVAFGSRHGQQERGGR